MKIKKQYIFTVLVLIIIFIIGFSSLSLNKKDNIPIVKEGEQNQIETNLNTNEQEKVSETPIQKVNKSENPRISTDTNNIDVSLTVDDKKYETNIKEGTSVFDAMEKMQKESLNGNIFNFKYTNNAILGNFITEINGQYGTPGKYWIYYVNDKKASVGVSNYILKDGDIISWVQEGI